MEIYEGMSTFPGIAIGKIRYHFKTKGSGYPHAASDVKQEVARYRKAEKKTLEHLRESYSQALQGTKKSEALRRQIEILEGSGFSRAIIGMITSEKVNVSYALVTTRDEITTTFSRLQDEAALNRIHDIQEISNWMTYVLENLPKEEIPLHEPVIIAADHMSPDELMGLDKRKILGFLTRKGSPVSHASILVKSMDVPALVHVSVNAGWEGRLCIIDGYVGKAYIDPEAQVLQEYQKRQALETEEKEYLLSLKDEEDVTADGRRVKLYANIGNMEDLSSALDNGARGIGLLRSEFQYLGRENYPGEIELFQEYRHAALTMDDKLVIIRTLDIGADKKAEYMELPEEVNPAMGNRGIRICLQRKEMFKEQLRAIYRASAYGNLAIMYPMVTHIDEIHEIRKMVEEVKKSLRIRDIPYRDIQQGIVVETPAAVMMAGELARELDFLSIGTNDLTQYTLAMDRQNPQLKEYYKEQHPAIMKMIEMVVREGHREGCWVGICGELAANTALTSRFLRMGVDMLSVVPACILPVRRSIREMKIGKV